MRPAGQIGLRHIAGHHRARAEADARQEHLHLLDGGVLRLIENDEGVIERAAAHERQRRDLDRVALDEARHAVEAQHLVQRVVHRPQVRIDLLRHVPRQEPEPLAGLDRRPHQHDAAHALATAAPRPRRRPPDRSCRCRPGRCRSSDRGGGCWPGTRADARRAPGSCRARCAHARSARSSGAHASRRPGASPSAPSRLDQAQVHLLGGDRPVPVCAQQVAQQPPRSPRHARPGCGSMPRRRICTPRRVSTRRRFASSGPHRLASRALSAGSSANSRTTARLEFTSAGAQSTRPRARAAQRPRSECGARLGDRDIDKALQQRAGPGKLTQRLFSVRPASSPRRPSSRRARPARAARCRPCVRLIAQRLRIELRLQPRQALLLQRQRHLIRQRGRRGARPAAVEEAERLIEPHIAPPAAAWPRNRARSRRGSRR